MDFRRRHSASQEAKEATCCLSPEEVVHFLNCVERGKHRVILTDCYAAGLRISEVVCDGIFHGTQPAGKFIDIGERVPIANERVHLRKTAVLQRNPGSAPLTESARQEAGIVEIPEAAIAVNEHRQLGRIDDALDHVDDLAP